MMFHNCKTCSYYYTDGFCRFNLSYKDEDQTCGHWTDEVLSVDYDFLYRKCKEYVRICNTYVEMEKLKKDFPDEPWAYHFGNEDFFLECVLNDLKRELSFHEIL